MPISIPKFFQKAFAQNGGRQDVPVTGDTSGGRASYDEGFPPITRTNIVAGGIPPFGTDFNGVLYDLSQAIQYVQSGVAFPFNQDFATAIGGYEIGAIVSDASDKSLIWINGTANNTAFPSGWTSFKYSDPTETVRGLPLVASNSEALALMDDGKMLTPAKLRHVFEANSSLSTIGSMKLPSGEIQNWGTLSGFDPIGAFNAETVGGITWYTHYYVVSLPRAYTTEHFYVLATLAAKGVYEQGPGVLAFVHSSKLGETPGGSLAKFTFSVTSNLYGWVPTIHFISGGK